MKVVFAAHGTDKPFGISKYFSLLARELYRLGVDVEIIVDSEIGLTLIKTWCGLGPELTVLPYLARGSRGTAEYALRLSMHLKGRSDFDILHTGHVTPFFYLMQPHHKPVVYQPFGNELFTLVGKGFSPAHCAVGQPVLRYCAHQASVVVSEGDFQEPEMHKFYPKMKKLDVLPVGVDVAYAKKKTDYNTNGAFKFLSVNSLDPYEGMDMLLDAFSSACSYCAAHSLKMTIVGGGKLEDFLKEKARALELPVLFKKHIPEEELLELYATADALVCPTEETDFQMGVLEAMAAGLPVITTAASWVPTSCTTFANDVDATRRRHLTRAMLTMVQTSTAQRATIGHVEQADVQAYDFAVIARKAISIYKELM